MLPQFSGMILLQFTRLDKDLFEKKRPIRRSTPFKVLPESLFCFALVHPKLISMRERVPT
jgi:hypothetical protein